MNRSIVVAEWHRALEALRAAETLTRDGLYADAISRAYYGILHSAKAALHVHEVGAESHSAVRRMFGLHPVGSGEIEPEWSAYLTVKSERDIFSLRNESLEESDNLPGPMFSLRRSSKISKRLSNSSAKSPAIYLDKSTKAKRASRVI